MKSSTAMRLWLLFDKTPVPVAQEEEVRLDKEQKGSEIDYRHLFHFGKVCRNSLSFELCAHKKLSIVCDICMPLS